MSLYAISDLHLAFNEDKPMDIFGEKWFMHHKRIKENWENKITKDDTVLIAGDISWSMKIEEGLHDLEWIHNLKGRKILIKGNHDYWWSSINKLNKLYEDMNFIQNNFLYMKIMLYVEQGVGILNHPIILLLMMKKYIEESL